MNVSHFTSCFDCFIIKKILENKIFKRYPCQVVFHLFTRYVLCITFIIHVCLLLIELTSHTYYVHTHALPKLFLLPTQQFDSDMKPLPPPEGKISQAHTSGIFLEKPGLLKEALKRNEEWDNAVPGSFGQTVEVNRVSTLQNALLKLREDQAASKMGGGHHSHASDSDIVVDPNDDGQLIVTNMAKNGASQEGSIDDTNDEAAEE